MGALIILTTQMTGCVGNIPIPIPSGSPNLNLGSGGSRTSRPANMLNANDDLTLVFSQDQARVSPKDHYSALTYAPRESLLNYFNIPYLSELEKLSLPSAIRDNLGSYLQIYEQGSEIPMYGYLVFFEVYDRRIKTYEFKIPGENLQQAKNGNTAIYPAVYTVQDRYLVSWVIWISNQPLVSSHDPK